MKKIFALALALVLTCTLAVTCFAAPAAQNGDVKATYAAGGTSPDVVYKVDVVFGAMEFTFTDKANKWNPEDHEYNTPVGEASWTASGNTVAVTNHSNAAVNVTVTYASETAYSTVTGSVANGSFELPSAVGKAVGAAELTKTATLTLGGTLASSATSATKVGTLTVSFS